MCTFRSRLSRTVWCVWRALKLFWKLSLIWMLQIESGDSCPTRNVHLLVILFHTGSWTSGALGSISVRDDTMTEVYIKNFTGIFVRFKVAGVSCQWRQVIVLIRETPEREPNSSKNSVLWRQWRQWTLSMKQKINSKTKGIWSHLLSFKDMTCNIEATNMSILYYIYTCTYNVQGTDSTPSQASAVLYWK